MTDPVPANAPSSADNDHLWLLSIFYYIVGGMIALFACFGIIHLVLGIMMIADPTAFRGNADRLPSPIDGLFGWMFALAGGCFLFGGWTMAAINVYVGRCLQRRKRWLFAVVVAAVDCCWMPFGTVLGVFSLVVLLRPSVKRQFGIDIA